MGFKFDSSFFWNLKGTVAFGGLVGGGGFKVVFLKISNPGFLQTSTFVTYFLILF